MKFRVSNRREINHAPETWVIDIGVQVSIGMIAANRRVDAEILFRVAGSRVISESSDVPEGAVTATIGTYFSITANTPNFIYVKTQGTLDPLKDWDNELHPTAGGFTKIAMKFIDALSAQFPGRIAPKP